VIGSPKLSNLPFPSPFDFAQGRLYAIVDVDLCRMRGFDPREVTAAFLRGGARLLQIRQKSGAAGELLASVRHAVAEGRPLGARVIVNDRADIAAMAGADGVHVGQTDLSPGDVRAIVGRDLLCGVSTHTPAQVDDALKSSAAYVAVGPVFRTGTKDTGYDPRGLELVRHASGHGRPVVAIGGITLARAREVVAAGATAVAVISDLLISGDPEGRVREYVAALG
jgi:thiamine-phosphate pyrophosphorylase